MFSFLCLENWNYNYVNITATFRRCLSSVPRMMNRSRTRYDVWSNNTRGNCNRIRESAIRNWPRDSMIAFWFVQSSRGAKRRRVVSSTAGDAPAARLARDRPENRPHHHGRRDTRWDSSLMTAKPQRKSKWRKQSRPLAFLKNARRMRYHFECGLQFQDDSVTARVKNSPNTFFSNTGGTRWPNGSATRTPKAKRYVTIPSVLSLYEFWKAHLANLVTANDAIRHFGFMPLNIVGTKERKRRM